MNLTRKAFKAYLEAMDPNDIAGRRQEQETCPLAQYIAANEPDAQDIEVLEDSIYYGIYEVRQPTGPYMHYTEINTQPWQKRFIQAIDNYQANIPQADFTTRVDAVGWIDAPSVVTAREALAALEATK